MRLNISQVEGPPNTASTRLALVRPATIIGHIHIVTYRMIVW